MNAQRPNDSINDFLIIVIPIPLGPYILCADIVITSIPYSSGEIKSLPNYGTSWIIDIDSKSEPTEPFCCTDRDMLTFLSKIIVERELFSHLFIGQMNWKIRGTNVIDKIFDSTISATKLPGSRERYFIETYDSVNGKREFMYKIDQC